MNKKLNRKIFFSIEKKFFYIFYISITSILLTFFISKNINNIQKILLNNIENLSLTLGYSLESYDIYGLIRVKENDIVTIIEPYKNKSIFLLPLKKISNLIFENNWVENVKIKTNYKNKVYIEIIEFKPIGIYFFNNNKYYFNSKGKIIDYVNPKKSINKKLITFIGESSTVYAFSLLNKVKKFNNKFENKILQASFVENRRWNLLLSGNILLKLSENNLEKSLGNFFKLTDNLSYSDLIDIKIIDLRDVEKAIIEYK